MKTTKTFRIFVSSTFEDLKAERDALQEHVFPALRRLCEERGCSFQAIDLRWGVAEEASFDQRTMPICLEELSRCQRLTPRPNFIVLLGDRYGWRPLPYRVEAREMEALLAQLDGVERNLALSWYRLDENAVPPEYLLQPRHDDYRDPETWRKVEERLRSSLERAARRAGLSGQDVFKYTASATEQEIAAGALTVEDAPEHVFCYFREIQGYPSDGKGGLLPETATFLDLSEDGRRNGEAASLLANLKAKLEETLPGNVRRYRASWKGGGGDDSPITLDHLPKLCEDVLSDLSSIILSEIERLEEEDELAREVEEHRAFAEERARVFVGRDSHLQEIKDYLAAANPRPLVIHGEGGCGKSALLARAAQEAERTHPEAQVVRRFLGATPASTQVSLFLSDLCSELARLCRRLEVTVEEGSLEKLSLRFRSLLSLAGEERPIFLFLDGLDQLAGKPSATLSWFPELLPKGVRLVASVREGEALEELRRRLSQDCLRELGPLPPEEGKELLSLWLAEEGRALQDFQEEEVLLEFEKTGNPLYLRLACVEACRWHSYDVDSRLGEGIVEIIDNLYEHLEKEYGKVLFSTFLSLLCASRYGLSEEETLDLLSRDEKVMQEFRRRNPRSPQVDTLPVAAWSRLLSDLEPYLTRRQADGTILLSFYHRELSEVAEGKYLTGGEEGRVRLALADYFEERELSPRKVSELPFQLYRASAWQRLSSVLSDPSFFSLAWNQDKYEVLSYWTALEGEGFSVVKTYRNILKKPEREGFINISALAEMLYLTGHLKESLSLWEQLAERSRPSGHLADLQAVLGNQAMILQSWGRLEEAMELLEEQERICRELGLKDSLAASLGNQAAILNSWGRLEEAMELLEEQERICRELGLKDSLAASLGNQAAILNSWGRLEEAMELLEEQERICRELGLKDSLAAFLGNQAAILYKRGRLEEAIELRKEEELIYSELGFKGKIQLSLGNKALILRRSGKPEEALELLKEQERICRELDLKDGLQTSLGNQALILHEFGRPEEALELLKEQERICRELDLKDGLQTSLGNQALILHEFGRPEEALELLKEQERICRELDLKDGLQTSLGNQALILHEFGRPEEALELLKEQERICRELGFMYGLNRCFAKEIKVLATLGRLRDLERVLEEREGLCREMGFMIGLAACLMYRAQLVKKSDFEKALSLAQEALNAAKKGGDMDQIRWIEGWIRVEL
ncbi:tetratricopeptide repeat protein [Candidatus Solincola tengchongensis]|uniref:tetratricopeptide repeat protein n=1 Tax=Candidatus Solincola tengchongensis TaxID=2900693 RepID=UPI00257C005A|nr:tetratricopeptide repeat protein [Candidatus Solincola tengchongensis]